VRGLLEYLYNGQDQYRFRASKDDTSFLEMDGFSLGTSVQRFKIKSNVSNASMLHGM